MPVKATRKQEQELADREIVSGLHSFPPGSFIRELISRVYTPFVHMVIDAKHDGMQGKPHAIAPEAVQSDCTLVMSNMVIELCRHMVPADDLGEQFAKCQQIVAQLAANLQEDLNHRAQDRVQQAVQMKRPN